MDSEIKEALDSNRVCGILFVQSKQFNNQTTWGLRQKYTSVNSWKSLQLNLRCLERVASSHTEICSFIIGLVILFKVI